MTHHAILTFSGWCQQPDTLTIPGRDTTPVSYHPARSCDAIFVPTTSPDIAIGWSLGAQIICRLVAEGHVKPSLIILISAPFSYVKTPPLTSGQEPFIYQQFLSNYIKKPERTLSKFALLSNKNDDASPLTDIMLDHEHHEDWIFWLEELGRFSCNTLDFSQFPHTILLHGHDDQVTSSKQAQLFEARLPSSEVHIIENCGHAPHLHDPQLLSTYTDPERLHTIRAL